MMIGPSAVDVRHHDPRSRLRWQLEGSSVTLVSAEFKCRRGGPGVCENETCQ